MMKMSKYHGLGNDYFVLRPEELTVPLTEELIRAICHRNFGAGSDGILLGPFFQGSADYDEILSAAGGDDGGPCFAALRIYNPDGSEAEKSGNGLRIFSQFLFDQGLVEHGAFRLATLGGVVTSTVHKASERIEVDMGCVTFDAAQIPVRGVEGDVIDIPVEVLGRPFRYSAASVGNPHCVVVCDEISRELACKYGPALEVDPRFPNRTNVQFMRIIDSHTVCLEIWERGAGYTLASGSSSSAAASVAVRLGLCESPVTVCMPGGKLELAIDSNWNVVLTGPACYICDVLWPA